MFMDLENLLALVTTFADQAHGLQVRKYVPDRYIVHPVRVMNICRAYTQDPSILCAALLHDVLEDTPVTREEIRHFLLTVMSPSETDRTLDYVVELTDIYVRDQYPHLNRSARKQKERVRLSSVSSQAQTIKYADVLDNAEDIMKHDSDFGPRFFSECVLLMEVMKKGHLSLRERTITRLTEGLVFFAK